MSTQPRMGDRERIDSEASAWLVRVEDGGLSPDERRSFEIWRNIDPRHAATYDEMAQTWSEIPELTGLAEVIPPPTVAAAIPQLRRRWRGFAGGLAAVAAAVVAAVMLPTGLFDHAGHYSTEVGEMRIVTMPDGSSVTLGPKSSISVHYTDAERRVVLDGGQAFFDVVHTESRPFLVEAGGSIVRDIGTKFDIDLSSRSIQVSVLEGRVAVLRPGQASQRALLDAGQRAELALAAPRASAPARSSPPPVMTSLAQDPGAWREGRLSYDNVRLADILSDVNRYYPPGVTMASEDVGELRVTASFKTSEIPAFVSALGETLPVHTDRQADGAITISRYH